MYRVLQEVTNAVKQQIKQNCILTLNLYSEGENTKEQAKAVIEWSGKHFEMPEIINDETIIG